MLHKLVYALVSCRTICLWQQPYCIRIGKGKDVVVLQMEFRWGAHLPSQGHWACRWIYHWACWPVRRQTYTVTFPAMIEHHRPLTSINFYCLVNRGTCVWTTCPKSFVKRISREYIIHVERLTLKPHRKKWWADNIILLKWWGRDGRVYNSFLHI